MKTRLPIRLLVSLLFIVIVSVVCNAQAVPPQKTFVSGTGSDLNPCTRTAPCQTFAGALANTAAGGEIDVLDTADYGPVTINQAVSIVAKGVAAGISVTSGSAITVHGGPTDLIVIRGLSLDGSGTATSGILFNHGGILQIDNCAFNNFTGNGVDFNPDLNPSTLEIRDSTFRNNGGAASTTGGVYTHPGASVGMKVTLDHVHFDHNTIGLRADDGSTVTMKDSDISQSTLTGVFANTIGSTSVTMVVENCNVSQNLVDGVTSKGASTIFLSNTSVTRNGGMGLRETGGTIVSFGNNRIASNGVDGNPTFTTPQK